jgi:hypothetical protein
MPDEVIRNAAGREVWFERRLSGLVITHPRGLLLVMVSTIAALATSPITILAMQGKLPSFFAYPTIQFLIFSVAGVIALRHSESSSRRIARELKFRATNFSSD